MYLLVFLFELCNGDLDYLGFVVHNAYTIIFTSAMEIVVVAFIV